MRGDSSIFDASEAPVSHQCADLTVRFQRWATPLPGATPRDNPRPLPVQGAFDGFTLREFLSARHPHTELKTWQSRIDRSLLTCDGHLVTTLSMRLRAGNCLVYTAPGEVEPPVAVDVVFLHQDPCLIVLDKPAPLPVHPCGRYNRNSLIPLLQGFLGEPGIRPVHRLDADTSGVMVLARNREAARHLGRQLERRLVEKLYLARVAGRPPVRFECDAPIVAGPGPGGRRLVGDRRDRRAFGAATTEPGKPSRTVFERLTQWPAEALVAARPESGRTNQIRAHLAHLGHPIIGDRAYGLGETFESGAATLCLRAHQISFAHPESGEPVWFQAPLPAWARES